MSGKHIWKMAAAAIIVAFSLSYLIPLSDTPFGEYLEEVSQSEEFDALIERARQRQASDPDIPSLYMALKAIANEERIDLSQSFPDIPLESALKNVEKRNEILLQELLERSKSDLRRGLDIQGGVAMTLQVDPAAFEAMDAYEREEKLSKAIEIIQERIDQYGVSEPIVRAVGEDRIEVQIAGISTKDNPEILDTIRKPARLDFREVHRTARPGSDPVPPGYEVMTLERDVGGSIREEKLYVKRIPALTGKFVDQAVPRQNEVGGYVISLSFDDEGRQLFGEITSRLAPSRPGEQPGRLAIVLDGKLYSAPVVREPIRGGNAEISGDFTQREAIELANVLNNPLDLPLQVAELYEVGPTLARDSIESGVRAATWGAGLVAAFMLVYYLVGGVVALLTIAANVVIVLGVLASFGATITLPGIAALVLTIGMAVDANILIFERLREELRSGKSLKAAVQSCFEKVFSTIFDANVTTLVVSVVMIAYGTGPVKGFGMTLTIGVGSTLFCALVLNRLLLELLVDTGLMKRFVTLSFLRGSSFDLLAYRKLAFTLSWAVVLVGVLATYVKRDTILGIDFTGGDELTIAFEERLDIEQIKQVARERQLGEVSPQYQTPLGGDEEILKLQTEFDRGAEVADALQEAFPEAGIEVLGENRIGPSVGKEIQINAISSIALALGCILLYIALRFEIGYGVGAVVATVHDILMTVGIFVLAGHQFSAPMVAAILLIVGYSLNDTIVVFDRIREELQMRPTAKLREIVNLAINAVLPRTVLTSFTTLLAAGSLYVLGTGVITDIAFTFGIGILTGTFSSVFIASPVFFWWHKGDRRSVESGHDVAPEYEWQASSKAAK